MTGPAIKDGSAQAAEVFSRDAVGVRCDTLNHGEDVDPGGYESILSPFLDGFLSGQQDEAAVLHLVRIDPDYSLSPPGFGSHEQFVALLGYCRDHPYASFVQAADEVGEMLRQKQPK